MTIFTVIDRAMTQNRNEKAVDILPRMGQEITAAIGPIIPLSTRYNAVYAINDLIRVLLKVSPKHN